MKVERYGNMTGLAGTERTVRAMERLVREGASDPTVIHTAQQLVRGVNQKDYLAQAKRLFGFIRNKVQYVRDPVGLEFVKTPLKTLYDRTGDCDDQAVLFSALARGIGFHTRLKAIKSDPRWPQEFSHVYSQVQIPGRGWVTSDTIVPGKSLGWEAPPHRQFGSRVWDSEAGMFGQYDVDTAGSSFGDGIVSSSDLDRDVDGAGEAFGTAGFGQEDSGFEDSAFEDTVEDIADVLEYERIREPEQVDTFDVDEGVEGLGGPLIDALKKSWEDLKGQTVTRLAQSLLPAAPELTPEQKAALLAAKEKEEKEAWKKYLPVAAVAGGTILLVVVLMLRKKRR